MKISWPFSVLSNRRLASINGPNSGVCSVSQPRPTPLVNHAISERLQHFDETGHSMGSLSRNFQLRDADGDEQHDPPQETSLGHHAAKHFHDTMFLRDDDPDKPSKLKECGDVFLERFRADGTKDALDNALLAYTIPITLLEQDDALFAICLSRAASAMLDRYELTGSMSDLNGSISKLEMALRRTRADDVRKCAARLTSLGIALARRFQRQGDVTDIERAILTHEGALSLTPEGDEDRPSRLMNLGLSLSIRLRDESDIAQAIYYQEQAIEFGQQADMKDPDTPAWYSNLCTSYTHRFDKFGDLRDISNAILSGQKAVSLTPESDYRVSGRLNNLAKAYIRRYVHSGVLADLSNAIVHQQSAVRLLPEEDSQQSAGLLNNLGVTYQRRFQVTKDLKDISQAISNQQKAIERLPKYHSHRAIFLHNLCISLTARFRVTSNREDISNAILSGEEAIRLIPIDHPSLPDTLNTLGNAYSRRFESTPEVVVDLQSAISCYERSVQLTPEDDVDKAARLNALGKVYLRRGKANRNSKADLALAIVQYRKSAVNVYGPPLTRLSSAEIWARFCRFDDPPQALEAYRVVIDLISRVAGLDQTIQRRHTNLLQVSTLTTEAAAIAFTLGEARTALEWLEQGRCLVWNQLNQLRTPLDDLFTYDEKLASRLLAASKELETLGSQRGETSLEFDNGTNVDLTSTAKHEEQTREHISKAQDYEDILREIREIPQFKNFLRPRSADDLLKNLPKFGFLVIVNVHERRSDALLLHHDSDPTHIPLKNFSYKKADLLRHQLRTTLQQHAIRVREVVDRSTFRLKPTTGDGAIQAVLSELWKYVAMPVLAHIFVKYNQGTERTRIWWCTTGPLAFLPVHAAGLYSQDIKPGLNVPNMAVSSYTPTVSFLVDRFHQTRTGSSTKFLLVSQPDTPDLSPIPGTFQETSSIRERLHSQQLESVHLNGGEATVDVVKKEMILHSWIHLACHAVQDIESPLQSGFHLHNGRLKLEEIVQWRVPQADFAFLSACQTSTGDEKLSEEAVHLAAGMLAAGYRSVVSTMWSIRDSHGPMIADEFYSYLVEQRSKLGMSGLSGAAAAYALDYALRKMRKEVKDSEEGLLTWVPYVHFGI